MKESFLMSVIGSPRTQDQQVGFHASTQPTFLTFNTSEFCGERKFFNVGYWLSRTQDQLSDN
jgi:hypothetical protein